MDEDGQTIETFDIDAEGDDEVDEEEELDTQAENDGDASMDAVGIDE